MSSPRTQWFRHRQNASDRILRALIWFAAGIVLAGAYWGQW